jgi:hypothetical protein
MPDDNFEVGHEAHEIALKRLGSVLKEHVPAGMGFTVLMFDYGPGGNVFYLSSAKREDMLKAMQEFIDKQQK